MSAPDFSEIRAAADRLRGIVSKSPFINSPWLSDLAGADVRLKLELTQPTGSYKVRGAANALFLLTQRSPHIHTVVTASPGNHGAACAWAAARLGLRVRVHVPAKAPAAKRSSLERLGAELIDAPSYDAAEAAARADAAASGCPYLSPYNDRDVIAGAGSVALEMLEDWPDLDTFISPLGGGGLLSGTAIVARSAPGAQPRRVIGAEAEASPVFTAALASGRVVEVDVRETLADSLAGNMETDSRTFGIVSDLVDQVALVAEDTIQLAMKGLVERDRLIAEGASATAVGAVLQGGLNLSGRHVGIILTGRNIDPDVIRRVISSSAAKA